jgi:hypothetical protein
VIAPAPERPYVDEVGANPGRIGLLDVHPRGDFVHEDCVTAVRAAVLKVLTTAAWSGRPSSPPAVDQSWSRSPSIRLTNLA